MSLFLFTEKEKWVKIKEILTCHWDHPFNLARLSQRAIFILEIKKHPKGVLMVAQPSFNAFSSIFNNSRAEE